MKLNAIRIEDFRSIESLSLDLSKSYIALCGANDSGKTNVVRAIRLLVREKEPFLYADEEYSTSAEDYPKWKECEPDAREVGVEADFLIHPDHDAGLYQSLVRQLQLTESSEPLELTLRLRYGMKSSVAVTARGTAFDGVEAQEVFRRIQSAKCVLFHNSTEVMRQYRFAAGSVGIGEIPAEHRAILESLRKKTAKDLAKIAKAQQAELEKLLGRLEQKYRVGLSLPPLDFDYMPFSITLGDRKYDVPLDDWGSGTRNRTLILHTLFRAKQVRESPVSASKVTPIIIVEEPESFLHPSAQAEFGRVLQDLASEFDVQVIVTSHSPYMLNIASPAANILLKRRTHYNSVRETTSVDTSGENWAEPFAEALGLRSDDFRPWRELFLTVTESVLLVEGSTDKQYLELMKGAAHGANALSFDGEILPYEGAGTLQNTALLRFLKNRYPKLFILYDLDVAKEVEKSLEAVGLVRGTHFASVGRAEAGKRNIEGLLPDAVRSAVFRDNADLVTAAVEGSGEERKSAKNRMKTLLLNEFKKVASPGPEFFAGFYALAKQINKALA
jgi:ABC-type cobalamin/Fe3+-siderophores transport system ATPase subunit